MSFIAVDAFAENCIHIIKQLKMKKKAILWVRIKNLGEKLDIKNIFDSIVEEIKGKFKYGCPRRQQI